MRKARDLIGLPVVELSTGEQVGEVRDVLFAGDGSFHSLLLEKGGLVSQTKVLPKACIWAIGQDAVTVQRREGVIEFKDESGVMRSMIEGEVHYVGKDVLTAGGDLLGTVEDVYLDDNLETIVGYEVSEGFLVDLREGRKVLPTHPEMIVGMDALVVPEDLGFIEG
ncbi:MAG TPA: PRC-barrel domain-containing protein [Bacilli bacterium]|nr:PRC-barrel domain-containing protein [Bacilli bacterium]